MIIIEEVILKVKKKVHAQKKELYSGRLIEEKVLKQLKADLEKVFEEKNVRSKSSGFKYVY